MSSLRQEGMSGTQSTAVQPIPRLLNPTAIRTVQDHESRYGCHRPSVGSLIEEVDEAGLRGRGGAGFPTALKMRAVAAAARRSRRPPVVVANATESEPASSKDKVLLATAPHLVFDGMVAASAALGAGRAVLCVDRRDAEVAGAARAALCERRGRDYLNIDIAEVPTRYVAGEETALVSWLNGGPAKPTFKLTRPAQRGVEAAPTLVDNVETLANLALIDRFGASAWRAVGAGDERGTMLVTVRGGVRAPGVYEIPFGMPLAELLSQARAPKLTGVLIGGYFGTWLSPAEASGAVMSARGLRSLDAALGCGLVAALPEGHCPLEEVSGVLRWMAANSAGQCGACVNGLPALAGAFDRIVAGDGDGGAGRNIDRWAPMLAGRGACKLPDGTAHFLLSSRRVFATHIEEHRRYGPCRPNQTQFLPTPSLEGWR
jgi:NADH:ubiquinone oxidoreductase subunit F (NADH-binding)